MKLTNRRAAVLGVAALLGAAALVAPTAASADDSLPAATAVSLTAYDPGYFGTGASVDVQFTDPAPTYLDSKVLVGYKALLKSGVSLATTVQTATSDNLTTTSFSFTGLNYGQTYSVGIVAQYLVSGTPTDAIIAYPTNDPFGGGSGPVTPTHHTPPVTGLTAKSNASGKLTLNWHAPSIPANTDPVSGYSILATPATDDDDDFSSSSQTNFVLASCSSTCSSYTVTGLDNGVAYDVVVSTTDPFYSSYFDDADVTATPYGAPTKPGKLTATHSGSKAHLKWKAAKSTKAGPVTGYKVYVGGKHVKTLGKSATSYTKTGIKNGKKYTFTVRAYNGHGASGAVSLTKKWKS